MKSKDVTLSATLIGLYISILVLAASTPLTISSFMYSALFGLFWNYFSLKRNLTIQAFRIGLNLISAVYEIPKLMAYMKGQSTIGLMVLDRFNATGYPVENAGIEFLEIIAQANPTIFLWVIYGIYASLHSLIFPYAFYRYFKWRGLFERIPAF